MRRPILTLLMLIGAMFLLTTAAIAEEPAPVEETETETAPAEETDDKPTETEGSGEYASYSGTWDSNAGPVELKFEGTSFSGSWNQGKGTFAGKVDGKKIDYSWTEVGEKETAGGKGWFIIVDETRIEGQWGFDDDNSNGGDWILYRK